MRSASASVLRQTLNECLIQDVIELIVSYCEPHCIIVALYGDDKWQQHGDLLDPTTMVWTKGPAFLTAPSEGDMPNRNRPPCAFHKDHLYVMSSANVSLCHLPSGTWRHIKHSLAQSHTFTDGYHLVTYRDNLYFVNPQAIWMISDEGDLVKEVQCYSSLIGGYYACVKLDDDWVYIAGGINSSRQCLRLRLDRDELQTLPNMACSHTYCSGAAILNKFYVVGSRSSNEVECYCPLANTWTSLPSMSGIRWGPTVVAYDDKLFVMGGVSSSVKHEPTASSMEVYDPKTNQWSAVSKMPYASEDGVALVVVAKGTLCLAA